MNAVEIADAVAELAAEPFDAAEFPFAFLKALGFSETTLKRLRTSSANASDIPGAYLLKSNVHIAVAKIGENNALFKQLANSPKMAKAKCKFVVVTDGDIVEAVDLAELIPVAFPYADLGRKVGFFFPLAGISTVKQIKDNPIDVRATGILNKLYVELLNENPDWATEKRRPDLNQFMARLIFCLFAEDTGIFGGNNLFTSTLTQYTNQQHQITHEVIIELFRTMDTKPGDPGRKNLKNWTSDFPYVNGGLFTSSVDCPKFSKHARSLLLRACDLNWGEINPDIFGSMIQAVADDDERGDLGMHYTSVPNILKVLDPLFLDDLREELAKAGDGSTKASRDKLTKLRQRIAAIRVFDPACGSGNFLVIAYLKMREIEWEIVQRLGQVGDMFQSRSAIKLTNFYGIEIKSFAAEIAKLSLLIAEFQANVKYIGAKDARAEVLPLHQSGQVHVGNALRLDWKQVCPNAELSPIEADLGGPTGRLNLDATQPSGEVFVCGNPPFKGARKQSDGQKSDLALIFEQSDDYKDCDYVSGWYLKAADFLAHAPAKAAFVSTSSICEGEQVPLVWSRLFGLGISIAFAHRSFGWSNNASKNAVVTCIIVGLARGEHSVARLFDDEQVQVVRKISPYLAPGAEQFVEARNSPISSGQLPMVSGSMPRDGGFLILSEAERLEISMRAFSTKLVKRLSGTNELINGEMRWCLWIEDCDLRRAEEDRSVQERIRAVREFRLASKAKTTNAYASIPHKFAQRSHQSGRALIVSATSSERRQYLPAALIDGETIVTNSAYVVYGGGLVELAIVTSRLHLAWIATVCGRLKTDYRYSKTLGWNTFPVPTLTDAQKADLTRCAEDILLAREAHFPKTIADLYDPDEMPDNLRAAHDKNDETLERIYIGRRFKNDTERLEKLFDMYTKMIKTEDAKATKAAAKNGKRGAA